MNECHTIINIPNRRKAFRKFQGAIDTIHTKHSEVILGVIIFFFRNYL